MNLEFLREAIRLSLERMEAGEGGPFGAVVAQGGRLRRLPVLPGSRPTPRQSIHPHGAGLAGRSERSLSGLDAKARSHSVLRRRNDIAPKGTGVTGRFASCAGP